MYKLPPTPIEDLDTGDIVMYEGSQHAVIKTKKHIWIVASSGKESVLELEEGTKFYIVNSLDAIMTRRRIERSEKRS